MQVLNTVSGFGVLEVSSSSCACTHEADCFVVSHVAGIQNIELVFCVLLTWRVVPTEAVVTQVSP